jgi:hypothetical protein
MAKAIPSAPLVSNVGDPLPAYWRLATVLDNNAWLYCLARSLFPARAHRASSGRVGNKRPFRRDSAATEKWFRPLGDCFAGGPDCFATACAAKQSAAIPDDGVPFALCPLPFALCP